MYKYFSSFPVSTSQTRTELSADADTNAVEFQLTSIVHTAPLCPLYVPKRSPFIEYHTDGVLPLSAEKSRSPSRLY